MPYLSAEQAQRVYDRIGRLQDTQRIYEGPATRAAAVLAECARILAPDGLLCLASLTTGSGRASRALAATWLRLWALRPQVVGGCRPTDLLPLLQRPEREVESVRVVTTLALATQVVIARRAG